MSAYGHHSASPLAVLLGASSAQSVCRCEHAGVYWKSKS